MNQSFDTQLQVLKEVLGEVVMPALGGTEKHVIEQLHLSLVLVDNIRSRLPYARRYYRAELRSHASLAQEIAALLPSRDTDEGDELRALSAAADGLLQDPEADWNDYIELTRNIRTSAAGVIESSEGQPHEDALDELVLKASAEAQLRARSWCEPFGFELRPEELPSLASLAEQA